MVERKEDIRITKKVRSWSYWLVPIASIGILTLIVQLVFSPFSTEGFSFNFSLGKLWKGDEAEQVVTQIDHEISLANHLPILENDILNKHKSLESVEQVLDNITPKNVHAALPTAGDQTPSRSQYIDLDLDRIDAFTIPAAPAFTQIFLDLAKQDNLLPGIKDLEPSKFRFGFSFTPSLNHRNLRYTNWAATSSRTTENQSYTFGQTEKYRNSADKPILGFSLGLDIYYNHSDRIYFQTGLYYSSMGEQLYVAKPGGDGRFMFPSKEGSVFQSLIPSFQSPEMAATEEPEVIPFTNYYGYFEIPFLVNYKIPSNGNIQFELQGGASYSYLDHADAVVYDFDSDNYYWVPTSDFPIFHKHNINTYAGVSIGTLLSPKLDIFLNPQFKYALRSTYTDAYPVHQNQYSFGVRMGLKMNLD